MPVNYSNMLYCSTGTCSSATLPALTASCACDTWKGRINDLYFVDCSLELTAANLVDVDFWQSAVDDGKIRKVGVGIGGYQKDEVTTFDAGGCGDATVEEIKWALNYQVFCVDQSTSYQTHEFANGLINGALANYNLVARYCDGSDVIVPIGKVDLADFDNILPTATTEFMSFSYKFTWKSLTVPHPVTVPGLSAVISKAVRG
jgi:hypothetical protein